MCFATFLHYPKRHDLIKFNPFNPVDLKRGRKFFSTSEKWKKFVFPCFAELFLCAFYLIPKPDFVLYKKTVEN